MQKQPSSFLCAVFIAVLLLTACTTPKHNESPARVIQNLDRETNDLAEVTIDALDLYQHAGKDGVLVVFDIDNTILAMEQGLGADQWYEWQKELNSVDKCNAQNVGNRFAAQGALYFVSAMRTTQEDGSEQVRALQEKGLPVIALTSRGPDFQLATFRDLRRNKFNFTHSAIGPASAYYEPFIPVEDGRLSLYQDGVFLTAGQHKGEMLFALLEKTGSTLPTVIVMVDDKQKNLDAVKETFSMLGVPVRAWRYAGEDANVKNFDPELADQQWKSIEAPLRQIQKVVGPDNFDLSTAVRAPECL
jgi:hypothetical protein